jgi:NADPH-dependent 2,4-dienoyl-CoA reductase/sulfur reductase-like enzyme/nitrite reductase/ring-hydroxylating ferredoxin subunit
MATADPALPDLRLGISVHAIHPGRMLRGRVDDAEVVLTRVGDEFFAVGAHCTHYHGPLAEGLVVGETVRCPLHHACFSLRTGEAVRAPALDPIACWKVERRGDTVVVTDKRPDPKPMPTGARASAPASVVIIGGGAAGFAAAEMLRRDAYPGPITMISADQAAPCDRPNLSKEFLSGEAPEDWIPLRGPEFYADNRIDLRLDTRVASIDTAGRHVVLSSGERQPFGALLIATGAEPIHLTIPGAAPEGVHYLRSLADSKAIVAKAAAGARAVVVGASFIGLEVAASLRIRGVHVDVVAPDAVPLGRILGPEIGGRVRAIHEAKGVAFHLGQTVVGIDGRAVALSGGRTLKADFVVAGIGVRPVTAVADEAGVATDKGIVVNEFLETSVPGIFAAGDVARWFDGRSGQRLRVEHWVVAVRQGQVAARNILGARAPFDAVPFFWSQHYDTTIRYVGHVDGWESAVADGDFKKGDCRVSYRKGGLERAVATIGRDLENLEAEVALEQ